MYYAIYCEDRKDSLERRRSVRSTHLQCLKSLQERNRLLIASPLLNEDDENPIIYRWN